MLSYRNWCACSHGIYFSICPTLRLSSHHARQRQRYLQQHLKGPQTSKVQYDVNGNRLLDTNIRSRVRLPHPTHQSICMIYDCDKRHRPRACSPVWCMRERARFCSDQLGWCTALKLSLRLASCFCRIAPDFRAQPLTPLRATCSLGQSCAAFPLFQYTTPSEIS